MDRILPKMLAVITRHPRHKVENIEWSKESVSYNLFRLWELLFWRRSGKRGAGDTIRIESQTLSYFEGSKQIVSRKFYTIESLVVYSEHLLRGLFKVPDFSFKIVKVPILTTPAGIGFPPIFSFAIAFDVESENKNNAGGITNLTVSHTCTGSNMFLASPCYIYGLTGQTLTNTYNSVSMVASQGPVDPGGPRFYLFTLKNPTTGANTLSLTSSAAATPANNQLAVEGLSYSGCNQTTNPDSSGNNSLTGSSVTTFTVSTTVVASNCWLVGGATEDSGGIATSLTPGAGTTYRGTAQFNQIAADSNATVGTGSQSLNWQRPASTPGNISGGVCSISPLTVTASVSHRLSMMGIGQ